MDISLTDSAVKQVKEIMREQNLNPETTFLRMGVVGGGCSGLSYSLEFGSELEKQDMAFGLAKEETDSKFGRIYRFFKQDEPEAREGVPAPFKVVIDKKSYIYLNGTTLDYVVQGLTGGFTFINPNAKSGCGCGASFSTE